MSSELPIVQKTYDLIKWYIPILDRLPRYQRFTLGDRIANGLYDLLEGLVAARFSAKEEKLAKLQPLNLKLQILRYQTRLLSDFKLLSMKRYETASRQLNEIGSDLGRWIKQQDNP
jgi:hypothetical protein